MAVVDVSENSRTETNDQPRKVDAPVVTVIVPPMVVHDLDPHTGIPFMPHMAAHLAGALRAGGFRVQVFDCFGLQHTHRQLVGDFMMVGASQEWVAERLHPDTSVCYLYCRTMAELISIERMIAAIKLARPDVRIALFENIQAVTSFSLMHVAEDLLANECDVLVLGEPERRACEVTERLIANRPLGDILGLAFKDKNGKVSATLAAALEGDLEQLPFPAWDLFPLDGYWTSRYAHGPITSPRILPILTSRGCPYKCSFCVVPTVNPTWRGRNASNVVDEMEHFYRTLKVTEFHISDLDPTVNDKRTKEICREIIRRGLPVTWKLAQGTKIETIKSEETLELMANAGCKFIAFSPESGDPEILKSVRKPFDFEHGLQMARKMRELGIHIQICLVAGLPGEDDQARQMTYDYAKKLLDIGVDEIAVYIFTPIPGAELFGSIKGYSHYSQLTHSPSWRSDYATLIAFRKRVYFALLRSYLRRPSEAFRELGSLFTRRFHTKMSMCVYKQLWFYALRSLPWLFPKGRPDTRLKAVG